MATPPTFPTAADLVDGTGTRSFTAVTTLANDWLVVEIIIETSASGTPAMSPLTWTMQNDRDDGASRTEIFQFTAQDTVGGSRTIQIVPGTTASYRARLTVVRGSGGPGTGKGTAAAQTVSVARQGANSAMFMAVGDWSAGTIGTPVWTPGGATVASQRNASTATYIFGRWDDSGAIATASHGISSPAYGTPSIAVLEMLGTAAGGPASVTLTVATATLSAVAVTGVPGQVTVALTPAVASLTAQGVTPTPGQVTVALTPAVASLTTVAVTAAPGLVTAALTPAVVTVLPVGVIPAGQGSLMLMPPSRTVSAVPVTAVPGPVTVALSTASAAVAGVNLSPSPDMITTPLGAGTGTWSAVAVVPEQVGGLVLQPAWATLSARKATPTGVPLPLNTYELPLAKTLLDCLRQVLTEATTNPPMHFSLRVGEQVPLDLSDNEDLCCEGLAYVKINRVYPSTSFPDEDQGFMRCGVQAWAADLEMGIIRCAPVGDIEYMPTDAEWTDAANQVANDSAAMRLAVACFRDRIEPDFEWLPHPWIPLGPIGACVGGTQIVTVGFIPCD